MASHITYPPIGGTSRLLILTEDLEKLKQRARKMKREQGISHHEALELVAQSSGLANWHQAVKANKAMSETESSVRDGIVIAMEIKETDGAKEIPLPAGKGRFVQDQMLKMFYKEFFYHQICDDVDETDGRPYRETSTDEEIREIADEILWEHAFFRFVGNADALDAESIVRLVAEAMFWAPRYVWIKGEVYEA
jgi:hypothetical protein